MNRVAIIGVGLIGGSFGLALKKHKLAQHITGAGGSKALALDDAGGRSGSTKKALERGAIDEAADTVEAAVADADLVFLSAPVLAIFDLLERIRATVPTGALITDAGSTKEMICARAAGIYPHDAGGPLFIGGHPMAGKEQRGVEAATPELFAGATWALTPWRRTDLETPQARGFLECVKAIGASPLVLDAAVHDEIVAWTSHLPQLTSTALAAALADGLSDTADLRLAGAGLRDTTRLAGSSYRVWRDICLTNSENIQEALSALIERLEQVRDGLKSRDLEQLFHTAQQLRISLENGGTEEETGNKD
jgi:prephenate dehydrogenase